MSLLRALATVSSMTFVSRVLGYVRDMIVAARNSPSRGACVNEFFGLGFFGDSYAECGSGVLHF